MPTLEQGTNHTTLESGAAAWKARSGAPTPPTDALEGTKGVFTANGDGTTVSFNVPHGLKNASGNGIVPSNVQFTAQNAVSGAIHWNGTNTTANAPLVFAVAPVTGTGNVKVAWVAYK
jgi:hypothetical protein